MTIENKPRTHVEVSSWGPQRGTWYFVKNLWVHESYNPNTALATGVLILTGENADHLEDRRV